MINEGIAGYREHRYEAYSSVDLKSSEEKIHLRHIKNKAEFDDVNCPLGVCNLEFYRRCQMLYMGTSRPKIQQKKNLQKERGT